MKLKNCPPWNLYTGKRKSKMRRYTNLNTPMQPLSPKLTGDGLDISFHKRLRTRFKRTRRFMSWFKRKKIEDLEKDIYRMKHEINKITRQDELNQIKIGMLELINKKENKFEYKSIDKTPLSFGYSTMEEEIKKNYNILGTVCVPRHTNGTEVFEVYYKEKDVKEDK